MEDRAVAHHFKKGTKIENNQMSAKLQTLQKTSNIKQIIITYIMCDLYIQYQSIFERKIYN